MAVAPECCITIAYRPAIQVEGSSKGIHMLSE